MPGQRDPSMSVQRLKFTREQWLHYLNQLTGEKICASCWAVQLGKYLDRFWWTAKLCFTNITFVFVTGSHFPIWISNGFKGFKRKTPSKLVLGPASLQGHPTCHFWQPARIVNVRMIPTLVNSNRCVVTCGGWVWYIVAPLICST